MSTPIQGSQSVTETDARVVNQSATSLPFVSVIMPIRNEAQFIEQSLGAVLAQDYPSDHYEVVVCDGMSTDDTRSIVQRIQTQHANVKLVDNPKQIAPTAMNAAMEHCSGDIIARVDGHCVIAPDYLRRCVDHLRDGVVDGVGGPIETIGQTPTARVIATAMSSRFGVGGSAFRVGDTETKKVDTIAFPVYTREIIDRAGPYDEQLVRNQDDEYNYRLRKMGGTLMLAPDVRSLYYSRSSFRKLAKQYFQYGMWKVRVLQKHPLQMRLRQFAPPVFVTLLLLLAMAAPFSQVALGMLLGLIAFYALVLIVGMILTAERDHGWRFVLLPATFATLHMAYGVGFLVGLVRFLPGWFRSPGDSSETVSPGEAC